MSDYCADMHLGIVFGLVVVAMAVAGAWWWHRNPNNDGFNGSWRARSRAAMQAVGPQRCLLAHILLRDLAQRGSSEAIARMWQELEGPLLLSLADCPPEIKPSLALALEDCSSRCRVAAARQAMMTMRNSLI